MGSLKLMGNFGIVGECLKIIRDQAKWLRTITLVFILPYVLIMLASDLLESLLLAKMQSVLAKNGRLTDKIEPLHVKIESMGKTEEMGELIFQLTQFIGLHLFCSAAFVPSIVAVVYTVDSVYNGKQQPSFTRVMRTLPAVCKHLITTRLWHFILAFMFSVAFVIVVELLKLGLILFDKSRAIPFDVVVLDSLAMSCMRMYMRIVWEVAVVMCVMEEEYYGFKGIKKSRRLLQRKRTASLLLAIYYLLISHVVVYLEAKVGVYVVGLGSKIVYVTASVVWLCVFILMGEVAQSVLYFACKSHHGESVDECFVWNKYEHVSANGCRSRGLKTNDSYLPIAL